MCQDILELFRRYVSSFERIAQQKGMQKGMEKGIEQGIGLGQAKLLRALIQQRFGTLPPAIAARIEEGRPEQLERWARCGSWTPPA